MNNIIDVNDSNFQEEIQTSSQPVLVDFWAPWCGPCKMLGPVLEEAAEAWNGKVKFMKMNTDENQKTAVEYHIFSIPTMLIFKEGREVDRIVGFIPRNEIDDRLSQYEEK